MRKNIVTISVAVIMALHSSAVCAQDEREGSDTGARPGMVVKRMGGRYVSVPEDSWVQKQGGMLVMEDISEYTAKKFMQIENRLAKIDADLEAIHKELQESKDKEPGGE